MKRLLNDAREAISSRFANHLIYNLIKQTELCWYNQTPKFRLSAEQLFVEVMEVLDEVKKLLEITKLPDIYKKKLIAVRQENYDMTDEECKAIVSIILTTVFSILGCSNYDGYRYELAPNIARQCAEQDKGYSRRLRGIITVFERETDNVRKWIDDEYMIDDQRYMSTLIGSVLVAYQTAGKERDRSIKLEEFAEYFTSRFRTQQRQQYQHVIDLLKEEGLDNKDYARYAYILYNSEELVPERRPKFFKEWYKICCELLGWTYVSSYEKDKVRDAYDHRITKKLAIYLTKRQG